MDDLLHQALGNLVDRLAHDIFNLVAGFLHDIGVNNSSILEV
jgi:hypothetical protein